MEAKGTVGSCAAGAALMQLASGFSTHSTTTTVAPAIQTESSVPVNNAAIKVESTATEMPKENLATTLLPQPSVSMTGVTPTAAVMGQPQMAAPTAATAQYFIAGPTMAAPNGSPNFPMQQILIPVTNPAQLGAAAAANCLGSTGGQQYITIPVSLGAAAASAQQLQILANPAMFTAANFTSLAGLQPFPMIAAPNHLPSLPQNTEADQLKMGHTATAPPVIISSPNFLPSIVSASQLDGATNSLKHHITSSVGNLPSINTLSHQKSRTTTESSTPTAVVPVSTPASVSTGSSGISNEILVSNAEPGTTVDGIDLDDIKEFARQFKVRRLSMGLTQTQVGQALSVAEGPAYSQSAICRFEKLDITPKSAQKIKPVLENWLKETEMRYKNGNNTLNDFTGSEPPKKRKRRTSFTPQAVELLCDYFKSNTHPSGSEMSDLADKLSYDREVVRVWFCNKRQSLKNAAKRIKSTNSDISATAKPS